jgi:hypothetical protein
MSMFAFLILILTGGFSGVVTVVPGSVSAFKVTVSRKKKRERGTEILEQ